MAEHYIQLIREKLQRRLDGLRELSIESFHGALRRTVAFLQENEITSGILAELDAGNPVSQLPKQQIQNEAASIGRALKDASNDVEHAKVCYRAIRLCAKQADTAFALEIAQSQVGLQETAERLVVFKRMVVLPLFDHMLEGIDDKRVMLALLKKYKERCEWFRRTELFKKCKANTRQGEKALLDDLCEYLHDKGVEFYVEPKSASGRIDLISSQSGKDRLAADAKIFNPGGGQNVAYLAKGFRQVYDYTKDFNELFGYLVIFKTCPQDLSIQTPHQESAFPFVSHNNKTIFVVTIDIFEYSKTASKRGPLKAYEITPAQLIESCRRIL
jgi:hypothetical protein